MASPSRARLKYPARFWRSRKAHWSAHIASLWCQLAHRVVVHAQRREAILVLQRTTSSQRGPMDGTSLAVEAFIPAELPLVRGCRPSEDSQRPFRCLHSYRKVQQASNAGLPSTVLPNLSISRGLEFADVDKAFVTPRKIAPMRPNGSLTGMSEREIRTDIFPPLMS